MKSDLEQFFQTERPHHCGDVSVKIFPLAKTLASLFVTSCLTQQAFAVCTTLVKGPIAIEVKQCHVITPEKTFVGDSKYNFIRDLPPANRKQFLSTYRGSLVSGQVKQSQAIREGISDEKGALMNEAISAFIPAAAGQCAGLVGKLVEVHLDQTCCNGGGESPCLLDTGFKLSQIKVTDAASASLLSQSKRSPNAQVLYDKAKKAAASRDFKSSAKFFEELRTKNELDVLGQFQLGLVYRELDKCSKAVSVLEALHQKFERKDYWTETEAPVRKGTFLYARCLSVLGRASESTLVLQGFLVERQRFQQEIRNSLKHRDFGYIKTSKSWEKYKKAAENALAAPPDHE